MKLTGKQFLSQPQKAITFIGMSGVGKSHLSCQLAEWGWHNYSCDYLIGTKYLGDLIQSEGEMSEANIENLSDFVGQLGDAARGGTHYLIAKSSEGTVTKTSVARLDTAERQEEIARMLSGAEVTPEARAQADRLLEGA